MDAHKDLMEAALNAVNAVEAKKSESAESAEKTQEEAQPSTTTKSSEETEAPVVEKERERPANAPKPAAKTAKLPQFPGLAEMAAKARKETAAASATPIIETAKNNEKAEPATEVAKDAEKAESVAEAESQPKEETKKQDNVIVLTDDDLSIDSAVAAFDNLLSDESLCIEDVEVILDDPMPAAASQEKVTELETQVADLEQQLNTVHCAHEKVRQENEQLKKENEQLKILAKQLNDRMIRVSADFDNYKKRVARDQEQNKNQAQEKIVTGFLSVMDNLERALAHARQSNDYDQLLQGVEMTAKLFIAALGKQGCTPYDSLGAEFDPVYHDVLSRVIDAEKPHNSIVQEHLKGYIMHDRVLRPALVVVAQHEDGDGE